MDEGWRDAVLLTLSHACSQEPSLIKEAEGKLKAWETEPGFYSLLMVRLQVKLAYYFYMEISGALFFYYFERKE